MLQIIKNQFNYQLVSVAAQEQIRIERERSWI